MKTSEIDNFLNFSFYRGRVGLYAILRALGVGKGMQVAIQAFTCVAVPEAVLAVGAKPVFVDIERGGVNIDPCDLSAKLTPQTRAIVVQHTFGVPAQMDAILDVAGKQEIPIIEDCCHTLASKYSGKRVGSMGVAAFYSFEWGKPLVAGIGGCLVVNNYALSRKVNRDYDHFRRPSFLANLRIEAQYLAHSLFYRPAWFWPIRATHRALSSIGLGERSYNPLGKGMVARDFSRMMSPYVEQRVERKLPCLSRLTLHAANLAREYDSIPLPGGVRRVSIPQGSEPVFARYPVLVEKKEYLLWAARREGVELAKWYEKPVHPLADTECRKVGYVMGSCPVAERRCREIVTLPVNPRTSTTFVAKAEELFARYG